MRENGGEYAVNVATRERECFREREKGKRGSLSMVKQTTHCGFVDGFGLVF